MKKKLENFPKNIELAQSWCLGGLKPAEHEFGNKKFLRCRIEGLQVDFQKKIQLCLLNLKLVTWGFFDVRNTKKLMKTSHDV